MDRYQLQYRFSLEPREQVVPPGQKRSSEFSLQEVLQTGEQQPRVGGEHVIGERGEKADS